MQITMKDKILARLSDAGDFVSGQQLCDEFGVSRTAVWKAVNRLKKEGYVIESVTNRGYRLKAGSDVLSESEIRSYLKTDSIGRKLAVYTECDSTNIRVSQAAGEGAPEGMVAVADRQTAGKGRRGRSWQSPSGVSISMSILLRPDIAPEVSPQITLVAALAVSSAIDGLVNEDSGDGGQVETRQQALIKWPNDIVMGDRKICGILTELQCQTDYIDHIVVGIGINVSNTVFSPEIADMAGSIFSVTGKKVNRNKLVAAVCDYFEKYYNVFLQTQNLEKLVAEYDKKLINMERQVRVLDPKGEYDGVAKGITDEGRLVVETPEGVRYVSSGEVSVRGIYGYV